MKLKDLVVSDAPDYEGMSSSKVWFNVANGAITIAYLVMTYAVAKMAEPAVADFAWLTLVFAGVVATNKFANKFLDYKYSLNRTETTTETTNKSTKVEVEK